MGLYATFLTVYCTHTDTFSNNEVSPWLGLWISMATGVDLWLKVVVKKVRNCIDFIWSVNVSKQRTQWNGLRWHAQMNVTGEIWASLIESLFVFLWALTIIIIFFKLLIFSFYTALNNLFLGRQVWHSEISVSDPVQYSSAGFSFYISGIRLFPHFLNIISNFFYLCLTDLCLKA